MKIFLIILFIVVGVIFLLIGIDILAFKPINKKKIPLNDLHENHCNINEARYFKSGLFKLRGCLYKADNPKGLIIFTHGIGSSSDYYIPEIMYLRSIGYNVFTFDYKGYYLNKGLFLGVYRAIKDLNNAIKYIDDKTLPISLIGHSMGGYAVSGIKLINKTNIKNIISISGFSDPIKVLDDLLIRLKIKKVFRKIIIILLAIPQSIFYLSKWHKKTYKVINNHEEINYLIVQSINDIEVKINTASIYAKKELITNKNCQFYLFKEPPFDTHMGIIRGNGQGKVNQQLMDLIEKYID